MAVIVPISGSAVLVEQVVQDLKHVQERILKRLEVETCDLAQVVLRSFALKKLFKNKSNGEQVVRWVKELREEASPSPCLDKLNLEVADDFAVLDEVVLDRVQLSLLLQVVLHVDRDDVAERKFIEGNVVIASQVVS